MDPRQKVAMALQAQRGMMPQRPGLGGLAGLGQAAVQAMAMHKFKPQVPMMAGPEQAGTFTVGPQGPGGWQPLGGGA